MLKFYLDLNSLLIKGAPFKKSIKTKNNIVGNSPAIYFCPLGRELNRGSRPAIKNNQN
jgi:hypothetical protein